MLEKGSSQSFGHERCETAKHFRNDLAYIRTALHGYNSSGVEVACATGFRAGVGGTVEAALVGLAGLGAPIWMTWGCSSSPARLPASRKRRGRRRLPGHAEFSAELVVLRSPLTIDPSSAGLEEYLLCFLTRLCLACFTSAFICATRSSTLRTRSLLSQSRLRYTLSYRPDLIAVRAMRYL